MLRLLSSSQKEAYALSSCLGSVDVPQPDSLAMGEEVTSLCIDAEDQMLRIGASGGSVSGSTISELVPLCERRQSVSPWRAGWFLGSSISSLNLCGKQLL